MRTIKFRQRNKNNGQWHYWGCIRDGEFTGPMTSDNYVRPEESNESTGLLDKNGKEIYEGDWLRADDDSKADYWCEVIWKDGGFFLREKWKQEYPDAILMPASCIGYFEYCGNIHENPELLNTSN